MISSFHVSTYLELFVPLHSSTSKLTMPIEDISSHTPFLLVIPKNVMKHTISHKYFHLCQVRNGDFQSKIAHLLLNTPKMLVL